MDSSLNLAQKFIVWALPVMFAITLHEVAHGWAACVLGDTTAKKLGRLSLNPLKHVDPLGTVLLPCMLLLMGGFMFGWAKPVPVDTRNLKNPRVDMALVALAGPAANLAMALGWGLLFKIALSTGAQQGVWYGLGLMGQAGLIVNVSLMVLNMLPLPPLDGGRVLMGLLPESMARSFSRIEPYGFFILIGLAYTGVLGALMQLPSNISFSVIGRMLGLDLI